MQRRGLRRTAAVAADDMQLRYRHVEFIRARVFQQQEFSLAFAQIEIDQPAVTRDAMLLMHDGIANLQFGQIAQHAFDVALFCGAGGTAARLRGVEFGLGDDSELVVRQDKTFL